MTTKTLYRYTRDDGGVTVSPIAPPEGTEYTIEYRLIADESKILTDGDILTYCIDVMPEDVSKWEEIDDPTPPEPESELELESGE